MKMRLDKFLTKALSLSRTEVKKILKSGKIQVNDYNIFKPEYHINTEQDIIKYDNNILKYREYIYLMLNKPKGYISATEDKYLPTVIDLLSNEYKYFKPIPVGRLDKDTEGLLLLTNDGKLTHNLLSPKKHIPKTYYVKSSKDILDEDIERLENGVSILDGYITKKSKIEKINDKEIYITIFEGKFHQIKEMLKAVNNKVIYLKRIAMGNLKLDKNLELGKYRELTEIELNILKENE